MVAINMTSWQKALKYKYANEKLKLLAYMNNPALAWVPKDTNFGGELFVQPVRYNGSQGRGTTVALAQGNQSSTSVERFLVSRVKNYSVHSIDREVLKASRGNEHAFLEAQVAFMDERVRELTQDMAMDLYGTGTGTRAIASTVTGGTPSTILLADTEDVVNFEIGMKLEAAATETGALRAGNHVITKVDRQTGTLTFATNVVSDSWALGDYLFIDGDAAATGALKKLSGFAAWCPASTPAATLFHNVDRTSDPTRLGGQRYDGSAETVHEAIINAGSKMYRERVSPDIAFINPIQYAEVVKALQGQVEYDVVRSEDGIVGFEALKVRTGAGTIPLVQDPNCPVGSAFLLKKESWKLRSLGPSPELVQEDGQVLLRGSTTDDFEVRFASYSNLVCSRPGDNMHITLAT